MPHNLLGYTGCYAIDGTPLSISSCAKEQERFNIDPRMWKIDAVILSLPLPSKQFVALKWLRHLNIEVIAMMTDTHKATAYRKAGKILEKVRDATR